MYIKKINIFYLGNSDIANSTILVGDSSRKRSRAIGASKSMLFADN